VIARNSSFTYKGKAVDIKQVGRGTRVRYVLEGSVRKSGNRVRITGQLIDAAPGHLWADRSTACSTIFSICRIASPQAVIGRDLPATGARRNRARPAQADRSLQAYDYYLRALASSSGSRARRIWKCWSLRGLPARSIRNFACACAGCLQRHAAKGLWLECEYCG